MNNTSFNVDLHDEVFLQFYCFWLHQDVICYIYLFYLFIYFTYFLDFNKISNRLDELVVLNGIPQDGREGRSM